MLALGLHVMCAVFAAEPPENLLKNGGFESGLESWRPGCLRGVPGNPYAPSKHAKISVDVETFVEGKQSVRFHSELPYDPTDPRAVLEQKIAKLAPGSYRLSVRYRIDSKPDEGFGLIIVDWTGKGTMTRRLPPVTPVSTTWRRAEMIFQLPPPARPWRVLLYLKGKGTLWYDDVRLVRLSKEAYKDATKLGPRDYHIKTPLVQRARSQAVIVSSSRRPAYDVIAKQIQARIKRLTGVEPDVLDAEKTPTTDVLARTNAVVLGNLVTSRFVETLYWEWYTLLDLWYPGAGGSVVRTLHDPYGTGKNVILLGGSDDAGVAEAARVFCGLLDEAKSAAGNSDLMVDRLMKIKLGAAHKMPAKGEWIDPRLRIFNPDLPPSYGYTEASRAGLIYHYNGDDQAGRRFRDLVLKTNVLTATDHYSMHMHALVWDLIEESPIFSDADRRAITEKLRAHAQGRDGTGGIGRLRNYPMHRHLLDRHASMQAICTLVEGRYFGKHWPSPEWEENLRVVRAYFDRQMTTGKGDSDLGGRGIYSYLECALIPALLMRDRRFIESGALRHYAELCLMHCDNTGYMPNSGQSSFASYPTNVFLKSAALLNDAGFLATMKRREEAERIGGYTDATAEFSAGQAWATGVEPKPMDKMVGVYPLPLTAWEHKVRGKSIPIEKSLDKLTMRTGFGRDDQYLLLDGLHGGPGGKPWPDINSIVNFGQNGRIFLVSDIGGQNPVNHNVVTVCKDGYGQAAGMVASLEAAADLPSFGYSHSRAAAYVFSTWDRHIFWRKGKWFVVLDALTAKNAGRYAFECQWRAIGEPGIVGSDFTSTVWEHAKPDAPRDVLHIKSAERLPLRFSEQTCGLFGRPEKMRWKHFCRQGGINRVRQVANRRMVPGDEQVFTNLLYVSGDRTKANYRIVKLDDHVAAVTGDEQAYVGLTADGAFERRGVKIRGRALCVAAERIAVVGATRIECPGIDVRTSAACNLELDLLTGCVTCESPAPVTVTANGAHYDLTAGTHAFSLETHTDDLMNAIAAQIEKEAAAARATRTRRPTTTQAVRPAAIPAAWTFEAGAEVLDVHAGDIDGDGRTEILLGLADGRATCLDDHGKQRWAFKAGGPVRAVSNAVVDVGPAALVGSDDEHVYALKPDTGAVLWKHKCQLPPVIYTWWTTGMKAKLQAILPHDVDGDGKAEIICGTGGGCVETLDSAGKQKWFTQIRWGIPDRLAVVPMPNGTKTLLVDNGRSSCGSTTWRLAANGKLLSSNACPTGRGSWDMTAIPGLKVVDLESDDKPEVVVGRNGAYNEVGVYDAVTGKRKWLHTLGDAACALAAMDVNADGVKEVIVGSPSAWLCAFDLSGKQVWATQLPHEIAAVVEANDGLLVACVDAFVYRVSRDGRVQARHALKGRPLWHFAAAGRQRIIGDATGHVVALIP